MSISGLKWFLLVVSFTTLGVGQAFAASTAPGIRYPASFFNISPGQYLSITPVFTGNWGSKNPTCTSSGLPQGVTINSRTCVISGTVPANLVPDTNFVVHVSSRYVATISLTLRVLVYEVRYPADTFNVYLGQSVNIVPQLTGYQQTATSPGCSSSTLPAGLQINPDTCAISSGPVWTYPGQPPVDATVNYNGPDQKSVHLTFHLLPVDVHFPSTSIDIAQGQMVNVVPELSGYAESGQYPNCYSYTLPPGITVDQQTCVVSGWFTSPIYPGQPPIDSWIYYGPNFTSVQLTFKAAVQEVRYPAASFDFYQGQQVNIVPQLVGFAESGSSPNCYSWTLPPGIQLDPTTCALSGWITFSIGIGQPPTESWIYYGNSFVHLTFNFLVQEVRYPSTSFDLYQGQQVNIVPQLIGFAESGSSPNCYSWTLPPGIQLDPTTCALSGAITFIVDPGQTPVESWISYGNSYVHLTFNFLARQVRYPAATFNLYQGQQVNIVPQLIGYAESGSSPNCYSWTLPPGIQLDPTTCALSGSITFIVDPGQAPIESWIYSSNNYVHLTFNFLPREVRYPSTSIDLYRGQQVNIVPQLLGYAESGSSPNCYSWTLPPGIQLDPTTCALSGSITFIVDPGQAPIESWIYSSNSYVHLTFNFLPQEVRYPSTSIDLYQWQQVSIVPQLLGYTESGSSPNCYSWTLPPGIQLDSTTCALSGAINFPVEPGQPPLESWIYYGPNSGYNRLTFSLHP